MPAILYIARKATLMIDFNADGPLGKQGKLEDSTAVSKRPLSSAILADQEGNFPQIEGLRKEGMYGKPFHFLPGDPLQIA